MVVCTPCSRAVRESQKDSIIFWNEAFGNEAFGNGAWLGKTQYPNPQRRHQLRPEAGAAAESAASAVEVAAGSELRPVS